MRLGLALDALEFIAIGMVDLDRRDRLRDYATLQVLADRLRAIAKLRGLSAGQINAQLLKIQSAAEALAGLGGGRLGDDAQVATIRSAVEVLRNPNCFGLHLDENE
jgi:hypothetical protein